MKTFLATTVLAVSLAMPAWAQYNCLPRDRMLEGLAEGFNQTRRIVGTTHNGMLMEIYASEEGTWTAVISNPQGDSCIPTYGEGFESVFEELPEKGDDL